MDTDTPVVPDAPMEPQPEVTTPPMPESMPPDMATPAQDAPVA